MRAAVLRDGPPRPAPDAVLFAEDGFVWPARPRRGVADWLEARVRAARGGIHRPVRAPALIALRQVRAQKLHLAGSIIAVVVSVVFMTTTQIVTTSIRSSFDRAVTAGYGDAAFVVRAGSGVESDLGTARPPVDGALIDRIRRVPGVVDVEGEVRSQVAVLDRRGQPVGRAAAGPSTTARNWSSGSDMGWRLTGGRRPITADELAMDEHTAAVAGFALDDLITVQTNGGLGRFRLVGVVAPEDRPDLADAPTVLFDTATAQRLLLRDGAFNWIDVSVQPDLPAAVMQQRLVVTLDDTVGVVTAAAYAEETRDPFGRLLDAIGVVLTVLAVVALVVGGFIIHNTFTMIVAQRARELALFRAVGASTRQVLAMVAMEAGIVGSGAALLGLVAGAALAHVLMEVATGVNGVAGDAVTSSMTAGTSLASTHVEYPIAAMAGIFVVATAVTVTSAWLPAWRASRTPPLASLLDSRLEAVQVAPARRMLGKALLYGGAIAAGLGLGNPGPTTIVAVAAGSAAGFVGMIVIGPHLVGRTAMAARPAERLITGRLAVLNALRNRRRSAATASALTIGVGLIVLFSIVVQSVKVTVDQTIDALFSADLIIDSGTFGQTGLAPGFGDQVRNLPGVLDAVGIELGFAAIDGSPTQVIGADLGSLLSMVKLDVPRGRLEELGPDEVAIDVATATRKGWKVGAEIPTSLVDTGQAAITVGGIFDAGSGGNGFGMLMSRQGFDRHFPVQQQTDNQIFVRLADGADRASVRAALSASVALAYPTAAVRDLEEYKHAQSGQLDALLRVLGVLLVLAAGIAVLGIGNTMALAIHERAPEIGLLRAVGMTRRQVRSMVHWESTLFSVQGALTGVTVGVAIGWAVVHAITVQGATLVFAVAWPLLAVTALAAIGTGLAASSLPAVFAARLDPVSALKV